VDYWGLEAIARRMGWKDSRAPVRAHLREFFPMFPRRKGQHPRKVYYSNDSLITAWELTKAKAHYQSLTAKLQRKEERRESHVSAPGLRR
jgi:hypothetical protein